MDVVLTHSGSTGNGNPRRSRIGSLALVCVLIGGLLAGCGLGSIGSAIDRASKVIDDGINGILARSDVWQRTLERIAQDLPGDVAEIVRTEAQNLATRTIAQAGTELMCVTDFYARRAVEALNSLKNLLLGRGDGPSRLPPAFCQVAPASINLNDAPSSWATVTLHGYDLDHHDTTDKLFSVLMQNASGSNSPLAETWIGRTTHYQVTLNLGSLGRTLHSNNIRKLVVSWNNSTVNNPEVVVVPWMPERRTESATLGSTFYQPPRTGGDRDFNTGDGSPTSIILRGALRQNGTSIDSQVYMYAREDRPDHTMVEGTSAWERVYTAPVGWTIVGYRPSASAQQSARVTEHGELQYPRPAGEAIDHFSAFVDRDGDEAGTWTHLIAHWRIIEVTIEETAPAWLR
ncbi:MAG: hypothetical protein IT323_01320 [Anaerolineae bacterium]|nr:hypothetical protein [Anaerolineae bacterium]